MLFTQYSSGKQRTIRELNNEAASNGGWLHSDECDW